MKRNEKCWDCGSTIVGHHTPLCDLAPKKCKRDLPQVQGTQWWNGRKPKTLFQKGVKMEQMLSEMSKGNGWSDLSKWREEVVVQALRKGFIKVVASVRSFENIQITKKGEKFLLGQN